MIFKMSTEILSNLAKKDSLKLIKLCFSNPNGLNLLMGSDLNISCFL